MHTYPALATFAAVLVCAVPAQAVTTEKVEFTGRYASNAKHEARGGLSLRTTFTISDPSAPAPLPLMHTTLRFPRGAVTNPRYFNKCNFAKLQTSGPSACSKSSQLGSGTAKGSAFPIVPSVNAKVMLFNGGPASGSATILIYAIPTLGPAIAVRATLKRGGSSPYGYILDADIPPIQTLPGSPNASVTFFDATIKDKTVRKGGRTIYYIDAPVLCDGTFFLLDGTFTYQGGLTNTTYERFTLRGGPPCP